MSGWWVGWRFWLAVLVLATCFCPHCELRGALVPPKRVARRVRALVGVARRASGNPPGNIAIGRKSAVATATDGTRSRARVGARSGSLLDASAEKDLVDDRHLGRHVRASELCSCRAAASTRDVASSNPAFASEPSWEMARRAACSSRDADAARERCC